jgi:O-antigen/teichoic acid export membrane protein
MGVTRTIAKNSLFNFITTGTSSLAMFIVGILLARYLGTEKYGVYSLMMWFLAISALVTDLGVSEMPKRFIAESMGQLDSRRAKGIIQLSFMVKVPVVLLVSLLIIALSGYLAGIFNMPDGCTYFIIIGVILLPYQLFDIFSAVFAGFQKYEYRTYMELVISPLRVVLVIIFAIFGFGVSEMLLTFAVAYTSGMLIGLFLFRRLSSLRDLFLPSLLEPAVRTSALKYSLAVLGIMGVDYFLWQQAEVMFLGIYRPVEEVGFYNVAHRIPMVLITLIPFVFGQVLLPAISEQFGRGDMERIKRIYGNASRYLMILSFPIATAGIALAGPIINILFGTQYASAIILMQIIFIPLAIRGLTLAVSSVIYGIKEPAYLLKMGVILVCVSIGLNLWLIPKYGAIGAVIATSIPRVVTLPIYIHFVSRKIKTSWPLVDTVRIGLASLLVGAVLFGLQYYLSDILSLVIGIPVGILTYAIALLIVRFLRPQDINILKQVEKSLPVSLRKIYAALIGVAERFVR